MKTLTPEELDRILNLSVEEKQMLHNALYNQKWPDKQEPTVLRYKYTSVTTLPSGHIAVLHPDIPPHVWTGTCMVHLDDYTKYMDDLKSAQKDVEEAKRESPKNI